ncbi:MAG TPA: hypothetical protein VN969_40075 [Streptosporangiaceae bacterium]|nr:hypothetical protein [Streptosporangiaceae bacterium]
MLTYAGVIFGQLISGAVIILLNLLVEVSYLFLDPRVRDATSAGGRR